MAHRGRALQRDEVVLQEPGPGNHFSSWPARARGTMAMNRSTQGGSESNGVSPGGLKAHPSSTRPFSDNERESSAINAQFEVAALDRRVQLIETVSTAA